MHINAHCEIDMVAVEATDRVTAMIEMHAPAMPAEDTTTRPVHTAIVVLDRSGSMSRGRLETAKRAIIELVARLDDRDQFGLVAFDNEVDVIVPAGRVGALGRDQIRHAVAATFPGGSTNLSGGYLRGLQEATRVAGPAGATLVLLSDGHANVGQTDPARLRDLAHGATPRSITTSTIGIGTGYDETLLGEIAAGGTGNHAFAADPDKAAAALAEEVDGLLTTTVQAASLLITPTSDVAVVGVLNDLASHPVDGGVMVEVGDLYAGEERRLLVELGIPAMAALGLAEVARLALTYVEVPALAQHTITLPVSVNVVPADVAAGRVPDPVVEREKLLLAAQRDKQASEHALRLGDIPEAKRSLYAAAIRLGQLPDDLVDEHVRDELDWLAQSQTDLDSRDSAYTLKRMRADLQRKARGSKNRAQGGEK